MRHHALRRRRRSRWAKLLAVGPRLWRNKRLGRALPWGVSLSLHLALIVAAAFIVWRVRPGHNDSPPMVVSFDEPAIAPAMAAPPAPQSEPATAKGTIARLLSPPSDAQPTQAPAVAALPPPPALVLPTPVEPAPSVLETGEPLKVEFSGLGASDARDIVYVVDASGSMITSMADVLVELERSIDKLHPSQRFQVLLFHTPPDRSARQPGYEWLSLPAGLRKPVLIDATRANKRAVYNWLGAIQPRLRSNPLPALEAALKLKPDAVFLLSSGATDPALLGMSPDQILDRLDRLNPISRDGRRRVVIRSIQVLEEDPLALLKRIARAHGGQSGYKFISADDLAAQEKNTGNSP